ncbi:hypothetical protein [Neolewinella antarctica]|uniref:Uncharacterized protein n=1 Tax=Neolewinella antarctica TaxID=442734 RepID=A0ABX0XCJ4_9BACT|nr:hypothetical protein [Neolewinella antarctica]NJC26653.1 hypothetical protein [Neolewinella antarctica]
MQLTGSAAPVSGDLSSATSRDETTRRLLYLYIALLIFEGALRKWFLPALSQPLSLVRDPIAILVIINYSIMGRNVLNAYTIPLLVASLFSVCASIAFGHGSVIVALFGLRTMALHFLLIFIIGAVFTRRDCERIGRYILISGIVGAVLVALQFYSPQSAWVNRGVGGDIGGAGFSGAMGYMRPSGYFSFSNGNTLYFGLVAAIVGYFWTARDRCPSWLLYAATAAVIMVLPLSISRSYVLRVGLTLACVLVASLRNGKALVSLLVPIFALPLVVAVLSQFEFMQTAIEVMSARFTTAAASEGELSDSIFDRVFGSIFSALTGHDGEPTPFWGQGIGLGTNTAAFFLSGKRGFLVAEGEWGRTIGEMGFLLGAVILLVRLLLTAQMATMSVVALRRGNTFPLLLLSTSLILILLGGWAQPTSLGFGVVTSGLTIASMNDYASEETT